MIDYAALASFMIAAAFTPGPNNILCLNNGIQLGFRKSYLFNVGVFVGRFTVTWLLALGGASFFIFFPQMLPYIRILGVCYILYLAYKLVRSPLSDGGGRACGSFQTAFILQFVNIKSLVTGITSLTVFVLPFQRDILPLTLSAVFISLFSFAGTLSWTLFGRLFQKFLSRYRTAVSWGMALFLLFAVIDILF